MMGVPISGPSYIYGYKMLFIHNNQNPESKLKNKSNYICYHAVFEFVEMGESLTGNVGTNKIVLTQPPMYYIVGNASSMCHTCYSTSMMICEHLGGNIRPKKCW